MKNVFGLSSLRSLIQCIWEELDTRVNIDQIGIAKGIVPLGDDSKISLEYLPDSAGSVVKCYIDTETNTIYEDPEKTIPITPTEGKIYIDLITNGIYSWNGISWIQMSSTDDLEEITAEEVHAMWDSVIV